MLLPGLHYAGPADPRLDRLAKIFAAAGWAVFAPFIPDFIALRLLPEAIDDTIAAFTAFLEQPEVPFDATPGIFSISFGSLLALRAAADARIQSRIGALVLFGGFADPYDALCFSLTGELPEHPDYPSDPLNKPVSFINFIERMEDMPRDPEAVSTLRAAWTHYIETTWGRAEYRKGTDAHHQRARDIAETLPEALQPPFLVGCGVLPGGTRLVLDAIKEMSPELDFLYPRSIFPHIQCPVHVIHGVEDDVIPYTQALALRDGLSPYTPTRMYLTGLYEHSQSSKTPDGRSLFETIPEIAREIWTMLQMLDAIACTGSEGAKKKRRGG